MTHGSDADAQVPDAHVPEVLAQSLHRAVRVEDAVYQFVEPRLRRRGWRDTIVPYTGYGTTSWVRVMSRLLLRRPEQFHAVRGWRSFATLPVGDESVVIDVGDRRHEVRTDRGGFIDVVVAADLEPGWRSIRLHRVGAESVEAPVRIIGPDVRLAVVSDIDDTVMVTALPRPLLAAWNTFVLDEYARAPVPGMAVLYERLVTAHPDAPVLYLSTGGVERRAGTDPFSCRATCTHPGRCCSPTGARRPIAGSAAGRPTSGRRSNGSPGSSPTSVGCSSATTGSTTRRSTATSSRHIRTMWPPWPSVSCLRRSRCSPVACRFPADGSGSADRHGRPWMSAPDGAGLARRLGENGLLLARIS